MRVRERKTETDLEKERRMLRKSENSSYTLYRMQEKMSGLKKAVKNSRRHGADIAKCILGTFNNVCEETRNIEAERGAGEPWEGGQYRWILAREGLKVNR